MSKPLAELTLCAWCRRYVGRVVARWDRWFCDDLCAEAWNRQRRAPRGRL